MRSNGVSLQICIVCERGSFVQPEPVINDIYAAENSDVLNLREMSERCARWVRSGAFHELKRLRLNSVGTVFREAHESRQAARSMVKRITETPRLQAGPSPIGDRSAKTPAAFAGPKSSTTRNKHPPGFRGEDDFRMRRSEDRYNFNPGMADIATGISDAENGRFEQTGLAHQFAQYATLERKVTWSYGNPEDAASSLPTGR